MKRILLPHSLFCSSIVQLNKNDKKKSEPLLIRRTELPLYSELQQFTEKSIKETANPIVLNAVKTFRHEVCKVARNTQSIFNRCKQFINTGIAHSYSNYITTVDYLHEKNNLLPRIGAIFGGMLCGYIFAIRRGFFKRFLYTSSAGIIVASVCYPAEANEHFHKSLQSSRKYSIIGYHFLNGVTKDLGGFELPSFPLKMLTSENQDITETDENSK